MNNNMKNSINSQGFDSPSLFIIGNINEEFKDEIDNQFPSDFSFPISHNRAMKIGNKEISEERCSCCEALIPSQNFNIKFKYKKRIMLDFGLDCVFYFFFTKLYFLLLYLFIILTFIYIIVFSVKNNENIFEKILQINKYTEPPKRTFRNLEIWDYLSEYNLFTTILDLIKKIFSINTKIAFWQLLNSGIIVLIYFYNKNKFEKYLKKILIKFVSRFIDESNYSVLVKNLPLYTNKEELKEFIQERYKTKEIIDIYMIPSLTDIEEKYEKLKKFADLGKKSKISGKEFDDIKFNKIKNNLIQQIRFNKFSGNAIILFDDPDDAKIFLRSDFDKERRHVSYYKKPDYYRGNIIKFNSIPSIGNINWYNFKFISSSIFPKVINVFIFFCFTIFLFFIYGIFIEITSPVMPAVILFVISEVFNQIIKILIRLNRFVDSNFENIVSLYYSTQKTTVMILFMYSSISNFTTDIFKGNNYYFTLNLFIYIILFFLKAFITAKFNYNFIYRKIKYLFHLICKRKLIQYKLNELYLDNEFNILENFENFRVMIYIAVISSLYSYLILIIMTIIIFGFYFFSNYALFTSNYSNRSYFQNYFFFIYYFDFINLSMIYLIKWGLTIFIEMNPYFTMFLYFILDTIKDIIVSFTIKDNFYYNKRYREVNHFITKKLENEKLINKKKFEDEISKINTEVFFKN